MASKVIYTTKARASKSTTGLAEVSFEIYDNAGKVIESYSLGTITKAPGKDFDAIDPDGKSIGMFPTKSKAGEALKRHRNGGKSPASTEAAVQPKVAEKRKPRKRKVDSFRKGKRTRRPSMTDDEKKAAAARTAERLEARNKLVPLAKRDYRAFEPEKRSGPTELELIIAEANKLIGEIPGWLRRPVEPA